MPRGQDGSIIGRAVAPTSTAASGIWTMAEVHKYETEGTWPIVKFYLEYLVIGGGAGVGSGYAGGGAGGYRTNFGTEMSGGGNSGGEGSLVLLLNVAYSVLVGGGSSGADATKTNGSPSAFSTKTCLGGGASGIADVTSSEAKGNDGGSGGGTFSEPDGITTGGAGEVNQGFAGGMGAAGTAFTAGGSGGGAGGIGNVGAESVPADGGVGLDSFITGDSVGRGGGGVGFVNNNNTSGTGTHGAAVSNGGNGAANTGAGGGPKANDSVYGNGGSGVVILRIPVSRTATFTPGVSGILPDLTVTGFKIYTITATSATDETVTFS